ncbi:ribonuclease III [Porphyromonas sp. COT-239 OH1446]|uniref:ribonuclease III n=1 Tax=Porphyromonas sp. COT-239 OH1446 TaxID=1515613 RepID=UPI0009DE548C|nr:ribonuclease III [Porphyromonas sp. COT-239 OH1446]
MLRQLIQKVKRLFGFRPVEPLAYLNQVLGFAPTDPKLYELAMSHSSCGFVDEAGHKVNNERLEFLGDSVLATAVSHYLYREHPLWDEGQMSKRRGTLVKRSVNNAVARRMGLAKLLQLSRTGPSNRHSPDVYGNALEALIGAIFLDKGYLVAEEFVIMRVMPLFRELEESLVEQTTNYKSLLLEWAQRHHLSFDFRMLQEPKRNGGVFVCAVFINDKRIGTGRGNNKKEAHQEAAHEALNALCKADPSLRDELGL